MRCASQILATDETMSSNEVKEQINTEKTSVKIRVNQRLIAPFFLVMLVPIYIAVGSMEDGCWEDDFEQPSSDNWRLEDGWRIEAEEGDNHILIGTRHSWAEPIIHEQCYSYTLRAKVRIIRGGLHLNFRQFGSSRYFLAMNEHGLSLHKQIDRDFFELESLRPGIAPMIWHTVKVVLQGQHMNVYINDTLKISYTDKSNPIPMGKFAFEVLDNSEVHFDDVFLTMQMPLQDSKWVKTGGPNGGLGYDIRIHPLDKRIMFVSDNPSGVNKSIDGGRTWTAKNKGMGVRSGPSADGIPIFSLTIDSNNPDIVWAGTQSQRGIYKSLDCGESWTRMDNGIEERDNITFRSFTVRPGDSDIVYAGAEISTGIQGIEFDKARGKIYKTEDGGRNWYPIWEGGSLARFIIIDPRDTDIIYASTGIFDREAYNDTGSGVLKSTDGGKTWRQINNGIDNLFVGYLEMHPRNPDVLFAAAGMNAARREGGVYRTYNGGDRWEKVLSAWVMTVVTFSPSDPNVIYAGSAEAFYRSDDGGDTWQKLQRHGSYGPPGIRAGVPISAVVDPDDHETVFVNNYGGGCFKSTDGGRTWINSSKGYTGADMHHVAVCADDPSKVYAIGRSGPFRSFDKGENWEGIAFPPANMPEWYCIAPNPSDRRVILMSDEHEGVIFRSEDGGDNWRPVFRYRKTGGGPDNRHGAKAIVYAPSDHSIVYAGFRTSRNLTESRTRKRGLGVYRSADGGRTWEERNGDLGDYARNINAIAVHPLNPDIVYIGTLRSGLYKTSDGGRSWVRKNNGLIASDVRSLAIDRDDPQVIYAGLGKGAGICKSTDGGDNWAPIGNGMEIICPPSLLPLGKVAQDVSFQEPKMVISSTDYAIQWSVITSVLIDPVQAETVYVSDQATGIYSSRDGGKLWTPINNGLSTKAVTDISMSADGKTLYAATSGEGVFRLDL
jgi:photosystem II stability/assembly factor-like uncharacterized protein